MLFVVLLTSRLLFYWPLYWVECLLWQFHNHVKVTNRMCVLSCSSKPNKGEESVHYLMSIRFNPVSSDISRWQWEINVPYQYLGGVMKISQLIYHLDRLYYSGKLNGFFFKYVISLLNFGRNYFRTSHLFLMFKNSSSQHQRKICVITTQLLDDKIRRKNPNLYKVHIFLHGRVWILSWLLCTIPYSFCIIIKKNLMVIILLGCVVEHVRICIR